MRHAVMQEPHAALGWPATAAMMAAFATRSE